MSLLLNFPTLFIIGIKFVEIFNKNIKINVLKLTFCDRLLLFGLQYRNLVPIYAL